MEELRTWIWTSLVVAVWVTSCPVGQSTDGGPPPRRELWVEGRDGQHWPFDSDDPQHVNDLHYFQDWASNHSLLIDETLIFGRISEGMDPSKVYVNVSEVYMNMSQTVEVDCYATNGNPVLTNKSGFVTYQYPVWQQPNWTQRVELRFVSSDPALCKSGVEFRIFVEASGGPPPGGPPLQGGPPPRQNRHPRLVIGLSVGSVAVVLIGAAIMVALAARKSYWHKERKYTERRIHSGAVSFLSGSLSSQIREEQVVDLEWPCDSSPRRFSFKELKDATKGFSSSQVLGEGGFGTVYKGSLRKWPGSPVVAIKRLSQCARQGAREFLAEVNTISQLRHRNLVHLLGWCDDHEDELLLVYEFMCNGDLDDLIFGSLQFADKGAEKWTPLPWKNRYNIFCGVAQALVYLHEEWTQRVIHRDVKTSNVMLDARFNARLGDFGLARLSAHSQAPRTTLVAGTIGYLAPEFNLTGRATDRTDLYAFGVVMLEVSCARRPLTTDCILVDWLWELHRDERLLDAIDPSLVEKSPADEEEMKRALRLGLLCCHPDPQARPSTRQVLNILTGDAPFPKMPRSKPVAYFEDFG